MDRTPPAPTVFVVPVMLAVMLLQLVIAQVSEPYPAVMMPAFAGVPGASGTIALREYRITATAADGEVFVDDGSWLFAELPVQYRAPTIDLLIAGRGEGSALRDWLMERLRLATGQETWDSVVFELFTSSYVVDERGIVEAKEPDAQYTVSLR